MFIYGGFATFRSLGFYSTVGANRSFLFHFHDDLPWTALFSLVYSDALWMASGPSDR